MMILQVYSNDQIETLTYFLTNYVLLCKYDTVFDASNDSFTKKESLFCFVKNNGSIVSLLLWREPFGLLS